MAQLDLKTGAYKTSFSPATLTADRTITLPDGDVTLATGTMLTSADISETDQWRLTTTFTSDANPITSNLERNDTSGFSVLGTGMTEASGLFTFPSTGYWLITAIAQWDNDNSGSTDATAQILINITLDNSAYAEVAKGADQVAASGNQGHSMCNFLFDVTSTTLCKCSFGTSSHASNTRLVGSSTVNQTHFTFLKLAGT